jgi:hypothetical protein
VGVPQTTIGFLDESGTPEVPCLDKKGGTENVFCIGHCFMGIHYWQDLRRIYNEVREAFGIDPDRELKWKNLRRRTGPALHMDPDSTYEFIRTLVGKLDPQKFKAVAVTLYKDEMYARRWYINEAQDVYNAGVLFALQRLQNDLDERYGAGVNAPVLVIADPRERSGQDNRLRKFVHDATASAGGGLWVKFDKSIVEGCLFQVSHYSVGGQLADFIAGAAFQKDGRGDETYFNLWKPVLRKSPSGSIDGYGYVTWSG